MCFYLQLKMINNSAKNAFQHSAYWRISDVKKIYRFSSNSTKTKKNWLETSTDRKPNSDKYARKEKTKRFIIKPEFKKVEQKHTKTVICVAKMHHIYSFNKKWTVFFHHLLVNQKKSKQNQKKLVCARSVHIIVIIIVCDFFFRFCK